LVDYWRWTREPDPDDFTFTGAPVGAGAVSRPGRSGP
jgi:hypothetical protein